MEKVIDSFKRAANRTFIGFEKENNLKWDQPFHFIQATDTQFGLINKIQNYRRLDWTQDWTQEIELTKTAIKQWNKMRPKPKFVVICGDLVDEMPGSEPQRTQQLIDFKKVFEDLDPQIPLVLLGGNHDFHDTPTHEYINAYKADFGDDYFAFYVNECMFIVINSQLYMNYDKVKHLYEEQEKWLDDRLCEAQNGAYKHVIVFQHIPWHLPDIKQPLYLNMPIEVSDIMVNKLEEAGVRVIFAGHYHRNVSAKYKDMEMVVTSAVGAQFSTDKNGYRVVYVNETNIQHEYVAIKQDKSNYILGKCMIS